MRGPLKIESLTAAIGAEVHDIQLAGDLDPVVLDAIYDAVIEHQVLFFRDQGFTPAAQLQFATTFGALAEPHPVYPHVEGYDQVVLLENDGDRSPDTDDWHTDLSFQQAPPFLSILYAKQVPEVGGDTLWSSMYAAFDALPPELQQLTSRLSAVHDMGAFRNDFLGVAQDVAAMVDGLAKGGSAVHPIAPEHPVTRRRLLFVNRSFTQHIVGMLKSESDRLLQYLFAHIDNPGFQVRFRWQNNSLAMWDNRCTQHFAVADYLPAYRCMHRVIVNSDRRIDER